MNRHIDLALIGGTGLYRFPGLEAAERHAIDTPYGHPSDSIVVGRLGDRRVAFLARHGESHTIPPHRVNYRANVWALHHLGARRVIGVNAVGGIRADMGPRVVALPGPALSWRISLSGRSMPAIAAARSSVEPSSTTTTSSGRGVCAATDRSVSAIVALAL